MGSSSNNRAAEKPAIAPIAATRCRPMVIAYAKRRGLQDADAEDAAQDTLADFVRAYREKKYDRTRGRLRHWLGGIAARRIAKLLSKQGRNAPAPDGPQSVPSLSQVPDPASPDRFWDEEWQRHLLSLCQAQVRQEFGEKHYHVFEQYALAGRPAGEVAEEVGITRNAVYICKTWSIPTSSSTSGSQTTGTSRSSSSTGCSTASAPAWNSAQRASCAKRSCWPS